MDDILNAEAIAAFAVGQRRGFLVGFICGAGIVLYSQRYTITRRRPKTPTTVVNPLWGPSQ
jgi:multisubunit Na+/H+ antiporter MnhE subunit